jgi:hypothetical protein
VAWTAPLGTSWQVIEIVSVGCNWNFWQCANQAAETTLGVS